LTIDEGYQRDIPQPVAGRTQFVLFVCVYTTSRSSVKLIRAGLDALSRQHVS
jgi:hypothetical protein